MFGLSNLYSFLIVGGLSAVIAGAGIGTVVHKIDSAAYHKLELGIKTAEAEALKRVVIITQRQDKIALDAAVTEAAAQQKIIVQTQVITKEVVRHVKVDSPCITFGFIRVYDAAVFGVSPDTLPLPAGQLDGTCAPLSPPAVASAIAENTGRARANAEQLDALEDFTLALLEANRTK